MGPIPDTFGSLISLTRLHLWYNKLSGRIPQELGYLVNLEELLLSYNNFIGSIPSTFGRLINLNSLYLLNNTLSGYIPRELGYLVNLEQLDLGYNKLMCSIPNTFRNLINLTGLYVGDNQLVGPIPNIFGTLTKLTTLYLNANQFSGHVPREIGNLNNLENLQFDSNNLSGPLPPGLCSGGRLKNFTAYDNNLIGPLPSSLVQSTSLVRVRLERKQIKGDISELGVHPNLPYMDLSSNKLFGKLSSHWGKSGNLTKLCLSNNNLTGEIPTSMGQLLRLGVLDLSSNNLEGDIPSEMGNLKFLFQLNLADNLLRGSIPQEIWALSSLELLDLSSNNLSVKKIHMIKDECRVNEAMFICEIKALIQIRHRNIIKLFGYCSSSQGRFLIYEYMERGDLAGILTNNGRAVELDRGRRTHIVLDVVQALAYMHHDCSSPIVHRDITSKNILLDPEFRACISDFGMAKILNIGGQNLTRLAGTKGYIAPELAYTDNVTEKCDVYSLGVLVLAIFMGSHLGNFLSSLSLGTENNDVGMKDLLDSRLVLPDAETAREIYCMLTVAVQCLEPNPSRRPTTRRAN